MYPTLLFIHSWIRWIVLSGLMFSIYRALRGFKFNHEFSPADDTIRHTTATIGHIQLVVGILLYIKSPVAQFFWAQADKTKADLSVIFFAVAHAFLMTGAIIVLTVGSALAKRKESSREKYRTILIYYAIALIIVFAAIPWPFSPFARRSYFRLH